MATKYPLEIKLFLLCARDVLSLQLASTFPLTHLSVVIEFATFMGSFIALREVFFWNCFFGACFDLSRPFMQIVLAQHLSTIVLDKSFASA